MKGIIFDIERNSFVDGPGIRTTVFFKGCNLKCAWCHNPESQSPARQMMFYKDKCSGCGKCREICPTPDNCTLCGKCTFYCPKDARKVCGKEYTVNEVLAEVLKDKSYYDNSGGGVTFSGGECMLQVDFLIGILKACKEKGIHTAVDTAGHVSFEVFEKVLPFTDLFLYDLKVWDREKHRKYVGVGNEQILRNLEKLLQRGARVWVRIPVIPGVNDSVAEMEHIRNFLQKAGKAEKVELLPYHAMGEHKYGALGRKAEIFEVPDGAKMERLRKVFLQSE